MIQKTKGNLEYFLRKQGLHQLHLYPYGEYEWHQKIIEKNYYKYLIGYFFFFF